VEGEVVMTCGEMTIGSVHPFISIRTYMRVAVIERVTSSIDLYFERDKNYPVIDGHCSLYFLAVNLYFPLLIYIHREKHTFCIQFSKEVLDIGMILSIDMLWVSPIT
jgi:hypothetical protein